MSLAPCPQVFYWTHLSYISVWTLLILHGPHFWKWFAVPGCLFVLEKVVGLVWRRAGGLRIVEVSLLPSKVCTTGVSMPLPTSLLMLSSSETQNKAAMVHRNIFSICKVFCGLGKSTL